MKGTAYLLQATLISLWWIGLLINQDFYDAFQFPGIGHTAFNSFMLPDLTIVALLSVLRTYNKKKALDYIILGGFGFATLYCVNATILTKGGFLPTTLMLLGLAYNLFLIKKDQLFRTSNTNNLFVNSMKTLLQIICIWTITLFVFPMLIVESFGVAITKDYNTKVIGILLFLFFSSIGIYSAYSMVKICLLYTSPSPRDRTRSRMPSSA